MRLHASRRGFLIDTLKGVGGLTLFNTATFGRNQLPTKPKTVLVLGGTNFIGPAIVAELLRRNHKVTLFNRGITNPQLFPDLEKLRGDRILEGPTGLASLEKRRWDVVIDTWPKEASLVRKASEFLKGQVGHYIFISSIAVYADYSKVGITEDSPLRGGIEGQTDDYGAQKVFCERAVLAAMPTGTTIIRPCAIVGERNPDDSFRYWTVRISRGGEILAPGAGRDPIQFIDVKDLARWVVIAAEDGYKGIYNAIGPATPLTWQSFLEACVKVSGSGAKLVWVDEAFLRENQIHSFTDVPLWAPLSEDAGFAQINGKKAFEKGLPTRPLIETINESLTWFKANFPSDYKFGKRNGSVGIIAEREQKLIEKWKAVKR